MFKFVLIRHGFKSGIFFVHQVQLALQRFTSKREMKSKKEIMSDNPLCRDKSRFFLSSDDAFMTSMDSSCCSLSCAANASNLSPVKYIRREKTVFVAVTYICLHGPVSQQPI